MTLLEETIRQIVPPDRQISAEVEKQLFQSFPNAGTLGALKEPCNVHLYSDSAYLVNAFNEHWIDNWQKKNWRTAAGTPVENQDLWAAMMLATRKHHVTFHKVKGHADNPENNRCDELATGAIAQWRAMNPDQQKPEA